MGLFKKGEVMENLFETWEVKKILGLSPRRIINWVGRGFITPAKEGQGPGISRKYSFENLVEMKIIDELSNYQMLLSSIKKILDGIFKERKCLWYDRREKPYLLIYLIKKDDMILKTFLTCEEIIAEVPCLIALVIDLCYIEDSVKKGIVLADGIKND